MRARPLAALVVLLGTAFFAVSTTRAPHQEERQVRAIAVVTTTTVSSTTTTEPPPSPPPRHVVSRSLSRPRPDPPHVVGDDTRQRVIAAIYAYSDWDPARMVRVASCESGLNPWAVNGSHHGIFQISGATLGLIEEHVALAHSMWQKRGMQPWQCKG